MRRQMQRAIFLRFTRIIIVMNIQMMDSADVLDVNLGIICTTRGIGALNLSALDYELVAFDTTTNDDFIGGNSQCIHWNISCTKERCT